MSDVQYWQNALVDQIHSIEELLQRAKNARGFDKTSLLDQAERKLREADGTKRSLKIECRLVSDPVQRRQHDSKYNQYEKTLRTITNDLTTLRSEADKGELFLGATTGIGKGGGEESNDPTVVGDALLADASEIQNKTKESLERMKRMTEETKVIGLDTLEELNSQGKKIRAIDEEAMKIEDELKRADKLIRNFGRRVATDKLIQCFTCVNVILLLVVVVWSIMKKGGLPGLGNGGGIDEGGDSGGRENEIFG